MRGCPGVTVGVITGVRVSHRRATVDEIEAACPAGERETVERLVSDPEIEEAFAIQTCNRAEAYVVSPTPEAGRERLASVVSNVDESCVVWLDHERSQKHLLRVASGLESAVLGEDQILGQVRDAYERAREVGGIGEVLEVTILKAIHVGERARTETEINEGTVSIGSAAVDLLAEELDIGDATALIVGAGEMGTRTADALEAAGVDRLYVANRTVSNATALVDSLDTAAAAHPLDAVADLLERVDVLIAATGSPDPVVSVEDLASAGETVVVDVSRPRAVDPDAAALPSVTLYDLDSLASITATTNRRRARAAQTVESMVDSEYEHLQETFKRKRADEAIATMYERATTMKEREIDRALSRLESQRSITDEECEVIASMGDTLVNQLLAAPTESLREAAVRDDWSTIHTALRLFDPEFDDGYREGAIGDGDAPDVTPEWITSAEDD